MNKDFQPFHKQKPLLIKHEEGGHQEVLIDEKIVDLVMAMDAIDWLFTTFSCEGGISPDGVLIQATVNFRMRLPLEESFAMLNKMCDFFDETFQDLHHPKTGGKDWTGYFFDARRGVIGQGRFIFRFACQQRNIEIAVKVWKRFKATYDPYPTGGGSDEL